MADDKKVRIGSEVDATGAKSGFDKIKSDAESMAQKVKKAGQEAGQGLDQGVGKGAEETKKKINKANSALNQSIRRQIGTLQRQLAEQASGAARGTRQYFQEYAKLRGADIDKLESNLKELEAVETRVSNALKNTTRDTQVAGHAVGNLAAQFQDIAVTAQAGMSPLTIALQQGTQISAAFGQAGAAGAISTLGAALGSIFSPLSLITIGITAAVAAAIQFGAALFSSGEEAKTLEDRISDFDSTLNNLNGNIIKNEKSIDSLRDKYGTVTDDIKGYIETLQTLNRLELKKQFEGIATETVEAFEDEISTFFTNVDFSAGFGRFVDPAKKMQELLGSTSEEATQLAEALFKLDRAKTFEDQLPALEGVYGILERLNLSEQNENIQGLTKSIAELLLRAAEYSNSVKKSTATPKVISDAQKKYDDLIEKVQAATRDNNTLASQLEKTDRKMGDSAHQTAIFKREIELLNAAKEAGIPISQKLREIYHRFAVDEAESARRVSEAQKELDKDPKLTFFEAASKGADEWLKKYENNSKQVKDAIVSTFDSAADAVTQFVMSGEADIGRFTQSVLADFLKIAIRAAIIQPIVGGLFGGANAGAAGGASAGTVASARGNAFAGGQVQAFANGGVFSSPITFPMSGGKTGLMAEAGPEAIMPLDRDAKGRLGVRAQGGQGVKINFQLVNQSSQPLAKESQQAFFDDDLKAYVVRTVITDYTEGGKMRDLIGDR